MTIVTKADSTWTGNQVVNAQTENLNGSYVVAGTTVVLTKQNGQAMNATTTDNWKTFVFKTGNTDVTMTKQ